MLRGKLPTSPKTENGEATMGNWAGGGLQVRYTSYCMNESIRTTRVSDCVYDEEIPVDDQGRYTIVVSRSEDRPANATQACGRAWVRWSDNGDGASYLGDELTDDDGGVLQVRTMLPDPTFAEAVQNTRTPGDEESVMGDYLPPLNYMSQADVESSGCGFSGLQQPINADGSSIFKLNRTIPVKFHLDDAAGSPVDDAVAKLSLAKVSGSVEGTEVEPTSSGVGDEGGTFRSVGNGDYHYNLSTKSLSAGTWSLRVTFKDGTIHRTHISLR